MALEKRDGNLYYYRSVRRGDEVRKVYVGTGEIARLAHERDVMDRAAREAERGRGRDDVERMEALGAPVRELCEISDVLARAHLAASGYRRVKGEWRLRRESA
jgi:hypothetical protein